MLIRIGKSEIPNLKEINQTQNMLKPWSSKKAETGKIGNINSKKLINAIRNWFF